MGSLALRFASGVVAVPFLLGTAYFGDPNGPGGILFGLVITGACAFAAFELRAHAALRRATHRWIWRCSASPSSCRSTPGFAHPSTCGPLPPTGC